MDLDETAKKEWQQIASELKRKKNWIYRHAIAELQDAKEDKCNYDRTTYLRVIDYYRCFSFDYDDEWTHDHFQGFFQDQFGRFLDSSGLVDKLKKECSSVKPVVKVEERWETPYGGWPKFDNYYYVFKLRLSY